MYNGHMPRHFPLSLQFIVAFSVIGFLLSAYSSAAEFFSNQCVQYKTCFVFLGLPACWAGSLISLSIITLAVLAFKGHLPIKTTLMVTAGNALFGVLFSGTVTALDLPTFSKVGFGGYPLGAPTCFIDLVCFLLTFMVAALAWSYQRDHDM